MKKAIILFNLGGPDRLENVEPFLFNLFNDPAILNLPKILRFPLAKLIANFFLGINRPNFVISSFTDEDSAKKWLLKQKSSN